MNIAPTSRATQAAPVANVAPAAAAPPPSRPIATPAATISISPQARQMASASAHQSAPSHDGDGDGH